MYHSALLAYAKNIFKRSHLYQQAVTRRMVNYINKELAAKIEKDSSSIKNFRDVEEHTEPIVTELLD